MAGYDGKRMSNNAIAAYSNGEMPLSKWTKSAIFAAVEDVAEEKLPFIKELTVAELKEWLLKRSSWHHTGALYNVTDFYCLDVDYIQKMDADTIVLIKARRKPVVRREKAVIMAEKAEKARKQAEKEAKEEKEKLFYYQTKYKSLNGFMKSTTIDFDKIRQIRADKIAKKREELREVWTRQGNLKGLSELDRDSLVEYYL